MDMDEYAAHGGSYLGPVIEAPGQLDTFGFSVTYVVDVSGHIVCLSPRVLLQHEFHMTPERQAFLNDLAQRTFMPFLADGRPEAVFMRFSIDEEESLPYHVMRPEGETSSALIRIEKHSHHGNPFVMTIHGDGGVTYVPVVTGESYAELIGAQTYQIAPEDVADMLDMAETADFWSLRDEYYPADLSLPHDGHAAFYDEITITLGGRTKTLRTYYYGGAPDVAEDLFEQIAVLGKLEMWENIDSNTLAQLALDGYDFRSEKAGQLLIALASRYDIPDSVIHDLISRGAPRGTKDRSLLDAVIVGRRTGMAEALIDKGALLKNGKPDPVVVSSAFSNAVSTANPKLVARLLSYHPDLTVRRKAWESDAKGGESMRWHSYPLITLVGESRSSSSWDETGTVLDDLIATTQILLNAGEDINSRDSSGHALLANVVRRDDLAFSKWLISKGATPTPTHSDAILSEEMSDTNADNSTATSKDDLSETIWLKFPRKSLKAQ